MTSNKKKKGKEKEIDCETVSHELRMWHVIIRGGDHRELRMRTHSCGMRELVQQFKKTGSIIRV